jgi:prepilin-type N-terminal cleavage/methylation domain-containing protein
MSGAARSFTLIEVMLAVAIFAFAAVGATVSLNNILAITSEASTVNQQRQAVESLAAKILASSNNLQKTGFEQEPWPLTTNWTLWKKLEPIEPPIQVTVPGTTNATRPMAGWWLVTVRAQQKKQVVDSVSFLVWPER